MTVAIAVRELGRRVFGSPAHDRLANSIARTWAELDCEIYTQGPRGLTEPWARSAYLLLLRAEADLKSWQIERGWDAVLSAQRAILSNTGDAERAQRVAITLRREADKITGWRAKAIQDLICEPNGNLIPVSKGDNDKLMRVVDAVALRDDFSQNIWFKILLRRRNLRSLFLLIWAGVSLCLALSWWHILPGFLGDAPQVSVAALFGVLGAVISVARSLVVEDVSKPIPAQQLGALLVFMRPGMGATLALVALALLHADKQVFHFLGSYTTDTPIIVTFSFLAGYSERFVMGALERLSRSAEQSGAG